MAQRAALKRIGAVARYRGQNCGAEAEAWGAWGYGYEERGVVVAAGVGRAQVFTCVADEASAKRRRARFRLPRPPARGVTKSALSPHPAARATAGWEGVGGGEALPAGEGRGIRAKGGCGLSGGRRQRRLLEGERPREPPVLEGGGTPPRTERRDGENAPEMCAVEKAQSWREALFLHSCHPVILSKWRAFACFARLLAA